MRSIAFALSLVFIFLIPWEGVVRLPIGTLAKILGILVGGIWMFTILVRGQIRRLGPFHVITCLFVMWNTLSIIWSAEPNQALMHVRTWIQILIMVLIIWDLYTTQAMVLAGLQAYVLGAYVAVGSAIQNYLAGNVYYTNYQRFSAGATNPDGFGFILALGIPVAWYLGSSKSMNRMGNLLRFINYAYIPAAFFGIALSGTRTALIASIVGLAYGLMSLARLRIWARITIFVVLSTALLMLWPYVQTMKSFERFSTTETELTQGTLNNRTNNWKEGLESFEEHPIIGVGSNMYRSVNSLGKVGHNTFVSVLVELGLVGIVLFGIIMALALAAAWHHESNWDKSFWLTVFAVWIIGSSTLTWEYRKTTWLFLGFMVVSAALTGYRERQVHQVARLPSPINQAAITQKEALSR